MKEIVVNSKKFGKLTILVDDEDYEKAMKYKWSATYDGCNYYFIHKLYDSNWKCIGYKKLHRYLLDVSDPKIEVDHINGNTLDNRRSSNLRICVHKNNGKNRSRSKNNTSGYKGVIWRKDNKKWRASITSNGKKYSLGNFIDKKDAARAYNEAAKQLHGEYAQLNKVDNNE
jgi:hypothetical protein